MAQPIETHYDILNVTRSAPPEVIKASYRVLSQKYHPDRNPDPEASHRMALINQAWDVLRDADKRATHDRWIAMQETQNTAPSAMPHAPNPPPAPREPPEPPAATGGWESKHTLILLTALGAVLLMFFALWQLMKATRIDDAAATGLAPRLALENAAGVRQGRHQADRRLPA